MPPKKTTDSEKKDTSLEKSDKTGKSSDDQTVNDIVGFDEVEKKEEFKGKKTELENLLHGKMLSRWEQAVKDQLVATLTPAEFPVLQEGGEIKPGLGDELTAEQWEKVTREFFSPGKKK